MCKAQGKEFSNYSKNSTADAFLDALSRSLLIRRDLLVIIKAAGRNDERGIWAHPMSQCIWRSGTLPEVCRMGGPLSLRVDTRSSRDPSVLKSTKEFLKELESVPQNHGTEPVSTPEETEESPNHL